MPLFSAHPVHREISHPAAADLDKQAASLACDVSFVSDDAVPPETLLDREIQRQCNPPAAALLSTIYENLRIAYDAGSFVQHRACLWPMISRAVEAAGLAIEPGESDALVLFFDHLNQVMFQHQTLAWLADSDFRLHLYGAGWDAHPTLSRFARGPIESDTMRLAIYRASRINLAAAVNGAVDSRLTEGVGVGGFFLIRFCPADLIERIFPPLWDFCLQQQIQTNEQLREKASPAIGALLDFASHTIGADALEAWLDLIATLREAAGAGYTKSAAAIWPQYPAVVFGSRDELIGLVGRYLYDGQERQRLAEDMRRQLVGRFEHVRVNPQTVSTGTRSEVAA